MKHRRTFVMAALAAAAISAHGAEPCASNFSVEKDAYAAKRYGTWQAFEGVAPAAAFKRLYRFVAQDGWNITASNAAAGVISANQPVSFSDGKTVPLNIVVEDYGSGGSKVSLNYATAGGLHSPQEAVLKHFCEMMAHVR